MEEVTDWRVSKYTAGQGNCVEVGQTRDAIVIRDTKNCDAGTLSVSPSTWSVFLTAIE